MALEPQFTQPQNHFPLPFVHLSSKFKVQTMLHLHQGLAENHVDSSDPTARINEIHHNSTTINFRVRRAARDFENYGDPGGRRTQFDAQTETEDESGVSSPPLWRTSPTASPKSEASPFHHRYRNLSPKSRLQAIARGQQELMEMVQNMPESSYELSLRDIVEHPTVQGGVRQEPVVEERNWNFPSEKKNYKKGQKLRSQSKDNGAFLLKMFFPISLGSKKKSSTTATCSKVSPRPPSFERSFDKECWKPKFSASQENEKGSISGSSSSGSSSSSSRSRHNGGFLPGCWSFFFRTKKSKTVG